MAEWKKKLVQISILDESNKKVGDFNVPEDLNLKTFKSIILNTRYNQTSKVEPVFFDYKLDNKKMVKNLLEL